MNTKLKILYTIPNFDTAGSGKVLYDLAKSLNPEKFEISIACKNNKGLFFKEVEALDLPIYFIDPTVPLRPYYKLATRISRFKNFVKENNFDIVHSWHWSSDWTEVLGTRWGGAKFVYTKKAMTWGNIHWKIRSYLSDFIITVNEEMKNYFLYKKNQKLIPFGIDLKYYNPELFLKSKQENYFNIITVAHLVPVKNVEVIIKALHILKNPMLHLDILGDSQTEYGALLKKKVKELKLEDQISFLGKHKDIRPFISQSDLYIISSKKEGMPIALVEAMTMEVPVLGSNISGIKFVLKDFQKLLFESSNAYDLSKKIEIFLRQSEEERKTIGKELRNYCRSYFSLDNFIQEHEELYLKLVEKN